MVNMRVRVLLFGQLREIAGLAEEEIEFRDGATLEELFAHYAQRYSGLGVFRGSLAASVNQELARWPSRLADGDEVAFLPPVSGGSGDGSAVCSAEFGGCRLVRERIPTEQIVAALKAPEDGAVVVFEGIVRNHSHGRETLYLEYESYETMALGQMRAIEVQLAEKFKVRAAALWHRLGRVEIGETSVIVAVTSAHRAATFDACRWAIDTLKREVPIWKKEFFAGGAAWAEGATPGAGAGWEAGKTRSTP
jgi:MoaE-MoaD fusion protein